MVRIFYLCSISLCMGCATQPNAFSHKFRPEDGSMARLERGIQKLCSDLVRDIKPGSIFVTQHDDPRPNASTPLEEHIVSALERGLIQRGFPVSANGEDARYKLMLTMIPSRKTTLVLASIWQDDEIISTREARFTDGPEKWNRLLRPYTSKTNSTIHIGSAP